MPYSLSSDSDTILKPYSKIVARATKSGPAVTVGGSTAVALGMILHEPVANAVKYGSLSRSNGRVAATWSLDGPAEETMFILHWHEHGGSTVKRPERSELGTVMLTRNAYALGGGIAIDYAPTGLTAMLKIPLSGCGA